MPPLTLNVNDRDITFTEPAKARAAARRWQKMARDLDAPGAPAEATLKMHELRARAKSANDWARREEDAQPAAPKVEEPSPEQPSAGKGDASPSRRRAAASLAQTGIRRTRTAHRATRKRAGRAVSRYERAGGVEVSGLGEFAIFFFGSLIALVLLEDVLTSKGSAAFAKATTTTTGLAHRVIAPIPLVNAP